MDRIVDKLIVFSCCAVLAAVVAPHAETVIAMLVALTLACAEELVLRSPEPADAPDAGRVRGGASGGDGSADRAGGSGRLARALPLMIPLVGCAFAVALPVGALFVPLAAYDLASLRRGTWAVAAAVPWAVAAAAPWAVGLAADTSREALAVALGLGALSVALARRTETARRIDEGRRRLRDDLQERSLSLEAANRDLADRRTYELRATVLEERARIAREIHDNVGHLLTRSILQVEALQVVHAGNARVRADFAEVGTALHEALDTVRASVHDLRDDAIDLSVQVERAARACPIKVARTVSVGDAPPDVASCLLAVMREALSNAERHSNATRIELSLIEHPGLWQLSVRDNGTRPPSPGSGRGMGLQSMEERVRALGGTFRSGFEAAPPTRGARKAGSSESGGRTASGFFVFASILKAAPGSARHVEGGLQ